MSHGTGHVIVVMAHVTLSILGVESHNFINGLMYT